MLRRIATLVVLSLAGTPALAHQDHSTDAQRCDTWSRPSHETSPGNSHHHTSSSDVSLGDPAHTRFHGHSGHYVLRNDVGYVEIVGGSEYRGPSPEGTYFPGQGGYIQGEIDPGAGAPDADFNLALFGPDHTDPPTDGGVIGWAAATYLRACANSLGQHQVVESRRP